MKTFNSLLNSMLVTGGTIGITISTFATFAPAAIAQDEPTPAQKAAPSLIGQCRAVNRQTPVFEARSTTSAALTLLKTNDKVTLAEEGGSNGLIAISKPAKGFIATANLKGCPGSTPPAKPEPKPTGDCRIVTQTKGLSVRAEPGAGAVVGGVAQNDKITLANPNETKAASDNRDWVKITKPVEGWVSEGFTGQTFRNLGACK
jgi:hypothetical protein